MSDRLLTVLLAIAVVGLATRLVAPRLGLREGGGMRPVDAALTAVGVLGLVVHCTAMFRPQALTWATPLHPLVRSIDHLSALPSRILYAVPAALVVLGLRRVGVVWLGLVALGLVAVGITMYDHGTLHHHLIAITVAVVLLSVTVALRTRALPPDGDRRGRGGTRLRSQAAPS